MFKKQERALKSLERALKICAKANIRLFGCDYNIYAMDGRKLRKLQESPDYENFSTIPDIARGVEDIGGWTELVETSDAYEDSGGA